MKSGYKVGAPVIVSAFILALSMTARANWPQLQGPSRDGSSPETGLLRSWPESGPRVLWDTTVGTGFGGPAVYDGEVYILDRVPDKSDILRCFSLDSGKELWRYEYEAPGTVGHDGSRTPPTVDEQYVYTVGMMGHFTCTDRKTHKPVWQRNLLTEFGQDVPRWGVGQSPSLYKNLVIVATQAADAYVTAFDRATGNVVWKSPKLGLFSYSTPVVAKLGGKDQVLMIGASNKEVTQLGSVAGISVEDGAILWKYEGWQCWIPIPYPTVLPDGRIFVTGGYKAGSAMFQVTAGDSGFAVKELYKLDPKSCGSQIHQPLLYKDHLYVNSNSNEIQSGMTCIAMDGTVKWQTANTPGLPLFEKGNLLLADGMILAMDGKTGNLHLVDPSPEGYKELARAKVLDGKEIWAPMALSQGKLVVRDNQTMKCLDLKKS